MGILLSGYLPSEEMQGLSALEARLLAEPDLQITAVVVLEQVSITMSRLDPDRDPTLTMRIKMLEPGQSDHLPKLDAILREARADRLGSEQLEAPLDPAPEPEGRAARTARRTGRRGALRGVPST